MGAHRRLRVLISLLVAAGALIVAGGIALLLANTVGLRNSSDATVRSDQDLIAVIDLERLVVDAETGLRGYVITGRTLFLEPTRAAQAQFPRAAASLERAAMRDGSSAAQARALVQAAYSYMTTYLPNAEQLAAHDPRQAHSYTLTIAGKRQVDAIRAQTAMLEGLVSARETARQSEARTKADHSITEAIVVLVILTVLTILLGFVLGRVAVGEERARKRSEDTARTLQESLLPRSVPAIPGCELAVRFAPVGAGELIGGDFYDAFPVAPERWAVVLGDVCGKGAEAAAVTAMARWTLRSLSGNAVDPADALRFLNESMMRQDLGGRFITIAYLLLTLEDSQVRASVACAGHPAPILVPVDGTPSTTRAGGTLLGIWDDVTLHTSEVLLSAGDSLIAYTDGVTDQGPDYRVATPDEMLRDRPPEASADQLAGALMSYAHRRSGRQRDDIAILALRFRGTPDGTGPPPNSEAGHHTALRG
jgi:serine phosphatase RsbU (regulator of sigma subunit)